MSALQVLSIVILSPAIICVSESVTNTQLLRRIESLEIRDSEKSGRIFALERQGKESEGKLQQLTERNEVLEGKLQQLAERNEDLEGKLQPLAERNEVLEGKLQQLAERNEDLEGKLRQLAERNEVLEGKLRQLAERNEDLEGKLQPLAERNEVLEGKLQQLAERNEDLIKALETYSCTLKEQDKLIHELNSEVQQLLNSAERKDESVKVTQFQLNDLGLDIGSNAETNNRLFINGEHSMKIAAPEKRALPSSKILAQQIKVKEHLYRKQPKQQQDTEYSTEYNLQENNSKLAIKYQVNDKIFSPELPRRLDTRATQVLTAGKDILRTKRDTTNSPVAFHAVIYDAINLIQQSGRPVMFPKTLLNLGDGFWSALGIFIAPRAGLYLFSASLMCRYAEIQAAIVKRDLQLARIYCPHINDTGGVQGSVTVATQLNVGDDVWIRFDYPPNSHVWGNGFSSFTGVLVTLL